MVRKARQCVSIACLGTALAAVAALGDESPAPTSAQPSAPVRSALEKGKYPWYDTKGDTLKPVWPPKEWDLDWLDRLFRRLFGGNGDLAAGVGNGIAIALAMVALLILVGVLVRLWRLHRTDARDILASTRGPGTATRIEGLPEGLRPETHDPWAEAVRARAQGDYARAVVCLFAHQLLTLDRLRQVRLVPGRTGRQLVRAIADAQYRAWADPTLRLFEAVYYGHRTPTAEAFEPVWLAAEAFQRRIAGGDAG